MKGVDVELDIVIFLTVGFWILIAVGVAVTVNRLKLNEVIYFDQIKISMDVHSPRPGKIHRDQTRINLWLVKLMNLIKRFNPKSLISGGKRGQ